MPETLRLEATTVFLDKRRFLETAPNAPANGDTAYASLAIAAFY